MTLLIFFFSIYFSLFMGIILPLGDVWLELMDIEIEFSFLKRAYSIV